MIYSQKRFWMHMPLGVITSLLVLTHPEPVIGATLASLFLLANLVYQVHLGKSAPDIQGIIAGRPPGASIVWLVQML